MYTPSVYNESCQQIAILYGIREQPVSLTSYDLLRCLVIIIVSLGLIVGNLSLALAVNSKHCANVLQFQVGRCLRFPLFALTSIFLTQTRCLLTSIATNNVATGLLVTVWNTYPSLISCWPYGILLCQIQVCFISCPLLLLDCPATRFWCFLFFCCCCRRRRLILDSSLIDCRLCTCRPF